MRRWLLHSPLLVLAGSVIGFVPAHYLGLDLLSVVVSTYGGAALGLVALVSLHTRARR